MTKSELLKVLRKIVKQADSCGYAGANATRHTMFEMREMAQKALDKALSEPQLKELS